MNFKRLVYFKIYQVRDLRNLGLQDLYNIYLKLANLKNNLERKNRVKFVFQRSLKIYNKEDKVKFYER